MGKINISLSYPYSEEYEYETYLERIDLDEERIHDITTGNGFIIADPNGIKKDIKDPNGMFSPRYGQTLKDMNPYANKYKCACGKTQSRINAGTVCPHCGTTVERVGDNFQYFGWKVLNDYYFIHPNLFKSLEAFIGADTLEHIIAPVIKRDENGNLIPIKEEDKPKGEPFYGIGMVAFKERFDEVLAYYSRSFSNVTKKGHYEEILRDKSKVWTQSVPFYTTLLRPFDEDQTNFYYEDSNSFYYMILKIMAQINSYDSKKVEKDEGGYVNQLLYNLQTKYQLLCKNVEAVLEKKKGDVRKLLSGRFTMSSRCVITPGPDLRIDEIRLPYACLVEMLQQQIINILHKIHNISYAEAHLMWYLACTDDSPRVRDIINTIIKNSGNGRGIPMLINRNPTIAYGGILQMFCIGISESYTMDIPLRILPLLAADYDGDVLNILKILNKYIYERCNDIFNPRNAFQISRNDGKFNNQVNHQRDVIINLNTATRILRHGYTTRDKEVIMKIKDKWKVNV